MPDIIANNLCANTVCTDCATNFIINDDGITVATSDTPKLTWTQADTARYIQSYETSHRVQTHFHRDKISVALKEVKIITNEEDVAIGVKITFENGDVQKAICSEDDVFNLEYGITICLLKQFLGALGSTNASRDYNNMVRDVLKQYEKQELAKLEEEEKKAQIEYRRAKRAEKKRRRAERKAAAERERQIEIQKEAYLRAMQEYDRQRIDRMTDDLK